jgi:hypothetical protein
MDGPYPHLAPSDPSSQSSKTDCTAVELYVSAKAYMISATDTLMNLHIPLYLKAKRLINLGRSYQLLTAGTGIVLESHFCQRFGFCLSKASFQHIG